MARPIYDVCVIGSGAAGGVVTKELCQAGAKVILLEAGSEVPPSRFRSHCWPYDLQFRGFRDEKQELFYPSDLKGSIQLDAPQYVFVDRIRVLGGRTVHWNAVVLRYAPSDFREHSLNGVEDDWPLSYQDLEPYYERIETEIGVCGNDDGIPILPAGKHYLPALPLRCSEQLLKRVCEPMGIQVISVRKALLTRPYDQRPSCHYCGHCMDGCDVSAIFSTPSSMLPKARRTGNLTLRQNALAREILVNKEGLVRAVSIVDRITKKEEEIRARIVVVCCATIESSRLLLNSTSSMYPAGLANSNGVVGRYLNGHMEDDTYIYLKELEGQKPQNQDGALDHALVPRYKTKSLLGTFDFQVNFGGYMYPYQAEYLSGYGQSFKENVRKMQSGFLLLAGYGKVLARPENRVTIHPSQTDAYGIRIPCVRFRFGDEDLAIHNEMQKAVDEISDRFKGAPRYKACPAPAGFSSHEVGTVRMGRDPKNSVLNSFCQAHEVKNLFVTDGSCFTTSSEKNPTLTIMALSLRASEYISEQRRRGDL
jgi:choline dehydrogenase-like flavoprotein